MPRASFSDTPKSGGGFGFQEGRVLITESYSTVFQYPPNSQTGKQSKAFCALVWKGQKLDREGNPLEMEDVEIVHRMGNLENIRPGKVAAKDFDNLDVEPEDLGRELDVRGNSYHVEPDQKVGSMGWAIFEDTLRKKGFKPEVLGRLITGDFEGMDITMKTVEGKPYIANQGDKKGQEITPTNLVCEHITVFPYDKTAPKKPGRPPKTTAPAAEPTQATLPVAPPRPPNGAPGNGVEPVNVVEVAKGVFAKLTPNFRAIVPVGKEVERKAFQMAMTAEMMRQRVPSLQTKAMIEAIKNDDQLTDIAIECGFQFDGTSVTFSE